MNQTQRLRLFTKNFVFVQKFLHSQICRQTQSSSSVFVALLKPQHSQGRRSYHGGISSTSSVDDSSMNIVDLRSDTLTKPTPRMRDAMRDAEVGDDVYGEDPTVIKIQDKCAELLGKEAALMLPTCTMANTIAVMVHCSGRFSELLCGDLSHMHLYEVGAMAQLCGVQGRTVTTHPDGTLDMQELQDKIRPLDDDHQPWTRLLCLENTQNKCGGKVLPLDYMAQVQALAKKNNLLLHLDGARVFNASTALGIPPSHIAQYFDTVSFCFSKGLACPIGSILTGSKDFISHARRARKALGGGMRQAGTIAAPMLVALEDQMGRLGEDHTRAHTIASGVKALQPNPVCSVDMDGVHTNIVMIDMVGDVTPEQFSERAKQVTEAEEAALGESISVLMLPFSKYAVRYVTHNDVSDAQVDMAVRKIQYIIKEMGGH